jgi:hypothetical protein
LTKNRTFSFNVRMLLLKDFCSLDPHHRLTSTRHLQHDLVIRYYNYRYHLSLLNSILIELISDSLSKILVEGTTLLTSHHLLSNRKRKRNKRRIKHQRGHQRKKDVCWGETRARMVGYNQSVHLYLFLSLRVPVHTSIVHLSTQKTLFYLQSASFFSSNIPPTEELYVRTR